VLCARDPLTLLAGWELMSRSRTSAVPAPGPRSCCSPSTARSAGPAASRQGRDCRRRSRLPPSSAWARKRV
jgi:hypothetical protein